MKYAGTITIYDDEGNTAYEYELSADEMITALLRPREETEEGEAPGKSTGRKCGQCGGHGHSRRTCPIIPLPVLEGRKSNNSGCKYCGQPGHMQKTCPVKRKDEHADSGEPLTEDQYRQVNEAMMHGLDAKMIAEEMHIDKWEVEQIFKSSNYEHYLQKR